MVMQDWITSELVTIDLKSPTINCLIQLFFVTVIGIYIYIHTHTHKTGGYQITADFIMEYHFIFEQLQKTKIMRKWTIVAILATRLLEFAVCAHHVFIVRIHIHTRGRLHTSDNDHCRTNRNQNLQMTCNNIWLSTKMQYNVSMSTGVRIAINLGATCKLFNPEVFYMKLRTVLC